jgi:hypothetical protein
MQIGRAGLTQRHERMRAVGAVKDNRSIYRCL